jgi:hypothetical protein
LGGNEVAITTVSDGSPQTDLGSECCKRNGCDRNVCGYNNLSYKSKPVCELKTSKKWCHGDR